MISYCDDCGEYLGDCVNGILFKFGQRVTEPHLCPGMDYSDALPSSKQVDRKEEAKTRTEELGGDIRSIVTEAINCNELADIDQLGQDFTARILTACQKAGLAFVVEDAKVPQRRSYKQTVMNVHNLENDIYSQGQVDAQEAMLKDKWRQYEEIELT